jgi:hypothetical protein
MRLTSLLPVSGALLLAACSGSSGAATCNCPADIISPLVEIDLPCGVRPPSMTLSGVCAGTAGEQDGHLVLGAYEGGTCHVALTFADGSTRSVDIQFSTNDLACGCEQLSVDDLPRAPSQLAALVVGSSCEDGGP